MAGTKHILIGEDDKDDQELLKDVFLEIDEDYELKFVNNGPEVLAALEKMEEQQLPCLIILDYNMPGMNGLELLEKIKTKYHKPPPVVMMVTAYGDDENFNTAKRLGADDFLTKPVDFPLLKEKLKMIAT